MKDITATAADQADAFSGRMDFSIAGGQDNLFGVNEPEVDWTSIPLPRNSCCLVKIADSRLLVSKKEVSREEGGFSSLRLFNAILWQRHPG